MFDQVVLLVFLLHLFPVVRKAVNMGINTSSPSPHPLSWKRLADFPASAPKRFKELFSGHPEQNLAAQREENLVSALSPRDCDEKLNTLMHEEGAGGAGENSDNKVKISRMARKRPARIVIPESCMHLGFGEACKEVDLVERGAFEVEGSEYCLASRRGTRHAMEDGYGVITNINGDSKQAFFGVFDGHGGRAAVDFVSEKLGKNIIAALAGLEKEEDQVEQASKAGYLTTDKEFLSQGVRSGACAATVLLKDGELHVANVGDCRVVMSKNEVATALTNDHRASRDDERNRIESLGGYVNCHNGVWRVQDSLAISRAIGDSSMKEWIISEPETKKLHLTQDCEFLVLASDGLWDKVGNQEAVDIVLRNKTFLQSCKDLVETSSSRGNRDDITVMIVDLQKFK